MNELLLIGTLIFLYGSVLIWYKIFGAYGLLCYTVFATIAANIEVLLLVDAFGMEMTLGNILFACTFLVTDILSEVAGKKMAQKAVTIGVATSVMFIIISQSWLIYQPNANDWAAPSIEAIFSNTPRLMFSSLIVYAITQAFDVWAYHRWWAFTKKKFGDSRRGLWLRNNGSTLVSQFFNTLLFTCFAFWGVYSIESLWSIVLSSYIIFIVTSLADTPIVYLARRIHDKRKEQENEA